MKKYLKSIAILKIIVVSYKTLKNKYGLFTKIGDLIAYFRDYIAYKNLSSNKKFLCAIKDLYPRINDKTAMTPLDPVYFYQGVWCAKKIFESKPKHHYDVASQAIMVGIISEFVPTTMIDIRPLPIKLDNLYFITGSVLALPFADNSIDSLSSICVIEHIGLGRYGDSLDTFGSEKSALELSRVLAPMGNLYISVPIGRESRVYFNAHRAFSREYILDLFKSLSLVEEKYIYGNDLTDVYKKENGFGTGLYHFRKI